MASVALQGISKTYPGAIAALSAIDLTIADGERFVLVGPSGSGKTTLLRLVAGLEEPSSGSVWIGKERVDGLAPAERNVAMVFQHPALYPHLSVFGNLAFGLRARGTPRRAVATRVAEVAARLGLDEMMRRRPATLSGGQRQRVALGRAIMRTPAVCLLDEPFSSLDAPLRAAMRAELIDLHRSLGLTMIHVTHDQAEAMALGERIAVMDEGRLLQVGTPLEIYDHPANRRVAEFIGSPPMSVLRCALEPSDKELRIRVDGCPNPAWSVPAEARWAVALRARGSGRIDLGIRPEHIAVAEGGDPSSPPALAAEGRVSRIEPLGHETLVSLELGPHSIVLRLPPRSLLHLGELVPLRIDPNRVAWFDADTGRALALEDSHR